MVHEWTVTGSSQSWHCLLSIWTATKSRSTVRTRWFHSTADWVTSLSHAAPTTCRSALRIPDSQSCEVLQAAFSCGSFCDNEFLYTDAIFISEIIQRISIKFDIKSYIPKEVTVYEFHLICTQLQYPYFIWSSNFTSVRLYRKCRPQCDLYSLYLSNYRQKLCVCVYMFEI